MDGLDEGTVELMDILQKAETCPSVANRPIVVATIRESNDEDAMEIDS